MSARQKTTRPRGFAPYEPRDKARKLIDQASDILKSYSAQLPLSIRQIFYILVSHYQFEKTDKSYKRLTEVLGRARRARLIEMTAIRDDGFIQTEAFGWPSKDAMLEALSNTIRNFALDRQIGQDRRMLLWCEAGGMVPQLRGIAAPFSVRVCSGGGFDSITSKYEMGHLFAQVGPVEVLHIGDHDPSGVHMFGSLDEDVRAFAKHFGGDVLFTRLAVTPEQVDLYDLPTAPPKATDNRVFEGMTTQAEALDPATLAQIVREAITGRLDMDLVESVKVQEEPTRLEIQATMERAGLWR